MNMDHVRLQMDRVALHITHTLVSVCGCVCNPWEANAR